MSCRRVQEAISARIDGEEPGLPLEQVEAHVAGCPDCRAFVDRGHLAPPAHVRVPLGRRRTRSQRGDPRRRGAARPGADAGSAREWPRYVLLVVALTQLLIALPALVLGDEAGTTVHLARELGSWDAALAIAWLVVTWAPRRAAGLLPFAVALAAVMVGTALLDVAERPRRAHRREPTTCSTSPAWPWSGCSPGRRRAPAPSSHGPPGASRTPREAGPRRPRSRPGARARRRGAGRRPRGAADDHPGRRPDRRRAALLGDPRVHRAGVGLPRRRAGVRQPGRTGSDRGNSRSGTNARDVVVDLEDGLADGTYIVTWRVISADSHPIHGGFVFSIGSPSHLRNGLLDSLLDQQGEQSWQAVAAALRGISYVGLLLAAGRLDRPGLVRTRARPGRQPRRSSPRPPASAPLAVLAALPVQAILSTGLGIGAITEPGVLDQVLGAGRRPLRAPRGRRRRAARDGGAGAREPDHPGRDRPRRRCWRPARSRPPGTPARPTRPGWPPRPTPRTRGPPPCGSAGWWCSPSPCAAAATTPTRSTRPPSCSRFSSVAGIALLVVAAAGGVLAWGEVRAVRAVTSTTYGWLLVVKTAIVALVVAAGAYNRFRLVPAVAAGRASGDGWRHLRRTVAFEAFALLAVLGVTGVLVGRHAGQDRGRHRQRHVDHHRARDRARSTSPSTRTGPVPTPSTSTCSTSSAGRSTPPTRWSCGSRCPSRDIGPITRTPIKAGPGHWQYDGDVLSIPGRWRIAIVARSRTSTRIRPSPTSP